MKKIILVLIALTMCFSALALASKIPACKKTLNMLSNKSFPMLKLTTTDVQCVDHPVSRNNKLSKLYVRLNNSGNNKLAKLITNNIGKVMALTVYNGELYAIVLPTESAKHVLKPCPVLSTATIYSKLGKSFVVVVKPHLKIPPLKYRQCHY